MHKLLNSNLTHLIGSHFFTLLCHNNTNLALPLEMALYAQHLQRNMRRHPRRWIYLSSFCYFCVYLLFYFWVLRSWFDPLDFLIIQRRKPYDYITLSYYLISFSKDFELLFGVTGGAIASCRSLLVRYVQGSFSWNHIALPFYHYRKYTCFTCFAGGIWNGNQQTRWLVLVISCSGLLTYCFEFELHIICEEIVQILFRLSGSYNCSQFFLS